MKKVKSDQLNISKIYLPIFIGIGVIVWLFLREFDPDTFKHVRFNMGSIGFILLAFLFIFGRDFGLIWRFRQMTDKQLTWRQAFQVHVLSEFTSAVTPAAVGGSALVILFLNKEGVRIGKSTTIMISNLFLDELFFVLVCPVIFIVLPVHEVFDSGSILSVGIQYAFWGIYSVVTFWTLSLYVLLFHRPDLISRFANWVFQFKFLRRWEDKINKFSEQLLTASHENSKKPLKFWLKAFGTTSLSWISRFLVVNALFMAFTPISNHLLIFARQILLWFVMKITPTPGSSGVSEYAFKEYYSDINLGSGPILVITVIWRIISYYMYLIFGALILPKWFKDSFGNGNQKETVTDQ